MEWEDLFPSCRRLYAWPDFMVVSQLHVILAHQIGIPGVWRGFCCSPWEISVWVIPPLSCLSHRAMLLKRMTSLRKCHSLNWVKWVQVNRCKHACYEHTLTHDVAFLKCAHELKRALLYKPCLTSVTTVFFVVFFFFCMLLQHGCRAASPEGSAEGSAGFLNTSGPKSLSVTKPPTQWRNPSNTLTHLSVHNISEMLLRGVVRQI